MTAAPDTKPARAARKTLYLTDGEVDLIIEALSVYDPDGDDEANRVDNLEEKMQRARQRRSSDTK